MNLENLQKTLDSWLESPEGKESLKNLHRELEFKNNRLEKAHNIIQERGQSFIDELIIRESNKYTEEYIDKCYDKGCEPHPTNITEMLFRIVDAFHDSKYVGTLDDFDDSFGAYTLNYMGYQFNWIYGQGTVQRIFKDGEELLRI